MGFLKANFQKEGKGISKDTPEKTGFALFLETLIRELGSLIKLNFLFLLFSIPIITIPASFAALTNVSMKIARQQHVFVFSDFKESFKKNWKQSSLLGIFFLLLFSLVTISLIFYSNALPNNNFLYVPLFICIFINLLLLFSFIYSSLVNNCKIILKRYFKKLIPFKYNFFKKHFNSYCLYYYNLFSKYIFIPIYNFCNSHFKF